MTVRSKTNKSVKCPTCNGKGTVKCQVCSGHGTTGFMIIYVVNVKEQDYLNVQTARAKV